MTRRAMSGWIHVQAEVAAARVMERVSGVTVTPHYCRIEAGAYTRPLFGSTLAHSVG